MVFVFEATALILAWGLRIIWIFMTQLMIVSATISLIKTCPQFVQDAYEEALGDDDKGMKKIRIGVVAIGLLAVLVSAALSFANPSLYYNMIRQVKNLLFAMI